MTEFTEGLDQDDGGLFILQMPLVEAGADEKGTSVSWYRLDVCRKNDMVRTSIHRRFADFLELGKTHFYVPLQSSSQRQYFSLLLQIARFAVFFDSVRSVLSTSTILWPSTDFPFSCVIFVFRPDI
jgi:hypothetical protein